MDDDLLADDGQFKDDGLDDLDIDEENALLGLSDDDTQEGRDGHEVLEYVDEDGNVVDIGENNAELYEVANVQTKSKSKNFKSSQSHVDEDVLELDLDTEESFSQEDPDFNRSIEPSPAKLSSKKDNLLTINRRSESEKMSSIRNEFFHSERDYERMKSENNFSSHVSRNENRNQYPDFEYDEESEEESVDDDHRERFKSERSNIITLTPITKNRDIPDTLESVISVEESARVQAFLENEQKRKLRYKHKGSFRGKGSMYQQHQQQYQHQGQQQSQLQPQHHHPQLQPQPHHHQQQLQHQQQHHHQHQQQPQQHQQQPQQHPQPPQQHPQQPQQHPQQPQQHPQQHPQQPQQPPQQPQQHQQQPVVSRKILINPHFKGGPRLPPVATSVQPQVLYPSQLVNVVSAPATSYEPQPQKYQHTPTYSHQETSQIPMSSPSYNAPPVPNTQYTHPDYPVQPPPQVPPPAWPNTSTGIAPGHNYSDPNSMHPAYLDPQVQNSNYPNNYGAPPGYQNTYQGPPPPGPHPIPYQSHQIPPQHPSSYAPPPQMENHPPMPSNQYMHTNPSMHQQNVSQQQGFQGPPNTSHQHQQHHQGNQMLRNRYNPPQRFQRQPEKRASNSHIRSMPMKQPRMDHNQRKTNLHVNSSNIREIPLVDTLPQTKKAGGSTKQPVAEEEDEKTKELRVKIEEQKLLREQILKRKEERRRQMASQRLQELQKRKMQQKNNTASGNQNVAGQQGVSVNKNNATALAGTFKPNVKQRIGAPMGQAKKKIIVVRKKAQQGVNLAPNTKASVSQNPNGQKTTQAQNSKIIILNKNENKQNINAAANTTAPQTTAPTQATISIKKEQNEAASQATKAAATKDTQPNSEELKKRRLKFTPQKKVLKTRMPFRMQRMPNIPQQRMPLHRYLGPNSPSPMFRGPRFCDNRLGFPMPGPHMNEMRMPHELRLHHPPNDMHMPHPHFQDHGPPPPMNLNDREPLLLHPREPMPPHFFPPDGPPHSPPRFRMPGHGFPGFRPRGDGFPDCFPPPMRFQGPMHHMFESNKQSMFQRLPYPPNSHMRHRSPMRNQNRQDNRNNRNTKPQASVVVKKSHKTDDSVPDEKKMTVTEGKPVVVTKKASGDSIEEADKQNLTDANTQTVMVENLSSCTNEAQLKKLCTAVGTVDSIELMKSERKAVIKFKQSSQALSFQKKYQRYMLDLAMIQVSLLPS